MKFDSRKYVYRNILERAWKYYIALGLNVEDIVFRKILYDSIYDVLENRYGKIHWKEFLTEYVNFINEYHHYFESEQVKEKLNVWEEYRSSEVYKNFIEHIRDVKRTDIRLKIAINNALAFMHLRWGNNWGEKFIDLEKKLKLDTIEKLWSKKAVWFLVDTLIFDASKVYAETEGRDVVYETKEQDAIRIYVKRWYERTDIVDEDFRLMCKIYDNILTTLAGEIGSVVIAESLRRHTIMGLLHIAEAARRYSKAAKTLVGLASILNGSVIGWLGWQIFIEWSFDEEIQRALRALLKYGYYLLTGDSQIFEINRLSEGDLEKAIKIYAKLLIIGEITGLERIELEKFWELATTKQKEILYRVLVSITEARRVYNQKKRLYDELNKEMFRAREIYKNIKESEREVEDYIRNFDLKGVEDFIERRNVGMKYDMMKIVDSKRRYIEMLGKEGKLYRVEDGLVTYCKPWVGECDLHLTFRWEDTGYLIRDVNYTHHMEEYYEDMYWRGAFLIKDVKVKIGEDDIWDIVKAANRYLQIGKQENIRVLLEDKLDKLRVRVQKNCISIIRKRNYKRTKKRIFIWDKIKFNYEKGVIIFYNWYYMYYRHFVRYGGYTHVEEGGLIQEGGGYKLWEYEIFVDDNKIGGKLGDRKFEVRLGENNIVKKSRRSKIICYVT
ncbi:MAG: hypothetical protein QXE05_04605 [Nitrososphaeria archaeon]